MRKKFIQLGVLALLLAVTLIAFVWLKDDSIDETGSAPAVERLYIAGGEDSPAPASVEINTAGESFLIVNTAAENEDAAYEIRGWEGFSLDSYLLGGVMTNAQTLAAKRLVLENPSSDDLISFGLLKPSANIVTYVTITNADGGVTTVDFGGKAPGDEGVYALSSNNVYLVATTVADAFTKPKTAFINKAVTATDPEFKGFDRITLSGANYPEPIIIERAPESGLETGVQTLNTHSIISPVNTGVDSTTGLTALNSVYGLIAADIYEVYDFDSNLEAYGLEEPAAVISVTASADNPGMTFELRVSETDSDGNVALVKRGVPVIYKVAASALPWLDLRLFDYMEKMPVSPDINTVSSVKLTLPDKSYEFTITGENETLAVTANGEPIDVQNFKQYYQTMISARYEDELPADFAAHDSILAQIEYRYDGGKALDTVTFIAGPTRRAIITHNGGKQYLCASAYVDRLIEDAAKVIAGETVKAYL